MTSSQHGPNQGEIRVGGKRFNATQKRSWWGGQYWTAGGISARTRRELHQALKAKYEKKAAKRPWWDI